MHIKPLLRFHETAEAAGYPALLIVAGVCLGIVVAPIGLLALSGLPGLWCWRCSA
jgi:hypothetical protein